VTRRRDDAEWVFHDFRVTRLGRTATLVLRGHPLLKTNDVRQIFEERAVADGANQSLMLLRVLTKDNSRSYFVDFEHGRTNVREVSPHLTTLSEALAWLLLPGYAARQGDVAFYEVVIPDLVKEVEAVEFERRLFSRLGGRHQFTPVSTTKFFIGADQHFFLRVERSQQVIHPEHPTVELQAGMYELAVAKGQSLPTFVEVRRARTLLVGL
jgi:hypothetical protein